MAAPTAAPAAQILVLGSLNMDLVVRVPRAPEAGETLRAHGFMSNPGGKGANQAVACARQGARVQMAGRVGDDAFGSALRGTLAADGIDVRHVVTTAASSGLALITVDDRAQNRIALVPGANDSVDAADAEALRAELEACALLLLQLEVPLAAVLRAAEIAAAAGARVVLNPAPAQPLPDALWPLIDLLVLNETEASLLAAQPVHDAASAARAALALRRRGPRGVIVTLGAAGVVVADARGCRRFAALPVTAIDTTAAGDTFIGALCAALVASEPVDAAIARGIQAAALCVTRPGAQASIPYRRELAALPLVAPAIDLK